MASQNLEKMASNDAQLRLLAPGKVSDDDKLVECDALLLDRFLDILQDLHGEDIRQTVQDCYELSAEYEGNINPNKLEELGRMLTSFDDGDSIMVAKSFSQMLNLANLAKEVQIAYRRRIKLKRGDLADEASAPTEPNIEETFKRLVGQLKISPQKVFDSLKNQTVDIIQAAFHTNEIRRTTSTPQDEMRAGMSYFHETIWKGVPKFLRHVDTALKNIGICERLSMWRCNDELHARADELHRTSKRDVKHYIGMQQNDSFRELMKIDLSLIVTFTIWTKWCRILEADSSKRTIPYCSWLPNGVIDVPEDATFANVDQPMEAFSISWVKFPLRVSLIRLDIRQESDRHTDVIDAITKYLVIGSYRDWSEERKQEWHLAELKGKRPLFGSDLPKIEEISDVLDTFRVISELPSGNFGSYIISMATAPSDVLAVELLQRECYVKNPLRVVPLFEKLADLKVAPAAMTCLFSIDWYKNRIDGKQEVMIGYSDFGKDAGRFSAAWQLYKAQEELMLTAKQFGVKLTMFHGRVGTVGRSGGPSHLVILSQPPDMIHGSLCVTVQGEVIEQSFGEERLCFRTLQWFMAATIEHGMNPLISPKPEWRALMDELEVVATNEYRSIVFHEPKFVTPELEYGRIYIGSRPSKRKPSGGIESLRAIPWIFSWTQTRFHLPVWFGFGTTFKHAIEKESKNLEMMRAMYNEWPFFRVTIDLVEMVFAKGNPGIAALYDKLLVSEELCPFGDRLRANYEETKSLLLLIAGHKHLLEGDPYLKQRLRLHDSYITTLNVLQAYTLKRIRDPSYDVTVRPRLSKDVMESTKSAAELVKLNPMSDYGPGLEDTLILTMKGIVAGMQNTG
ncbi:Phosphoenolpyruvate carboxylase [Cynara cardunculus var. scolymus]|uniref:Phosphoenolpyruvate carboxylase n=1 Tax=Cynara cardunculus var. scolymus TaxID=59895 RepID=A0A103XDL1_CYNCS|nr:Phosphoenolpyruvate carboxylase [Cynara cardunculus var. scolymus]